MNPVAVFNVGFSGTQEGMTTRQLEAVHDLLLSLPGEQETQLNETFEQIVFHHGCCIGADEEAAIIARSMGYKLHGHPPKNKSKMSKIVNDFNYAPEPYLERNKKIVLATKILIATPKTVHEVLRSGTWSTIRYSRGIRRPHYIINP